MDGGVGGSNPDPAGPKLWRGGANSGEVLATRDGAEGGGDARRGGGGDGRRLRWRGAVLAAAWRTEARGGADGARATARRGARRRQRRAEAAMGSAGDERRAESRGHTVGRRRIRAPRARSGPRGPVAAKERGGGQVARGDWPGAAARLRWRLPIGGSEVAAGGGHVRRGVDASGGARGGIFRVSSARFSGETQIYR